MIKTTYDILLRKRRMVDKLFGDIISSGSIVFGGVQTLTGAGAVNLTTYSTLLVTTGVDALTLADGSEGQLKFIRMKTHAGDGTLTPTNFHDGTTITFGVAGDQVLLQFIDGGWTVLSNTGAVVA